MLKENYKKIAIISGLDYFINKQPITFPMNLTFTPSRVILLMTYRSSQWYMGCDSKYGMCPTSAVGDIVFEVNPANITFTKDSITIKKWRMSGSGYPTLREIIAIE